MTYYLPGGFAAARFVPRLLMGMALCAAIALPAVFAADNLAAIQNLMRQGQYPQALASVDAYLADRPKDAQGRFMKGLILTELKRPNDAVAVFTKLSEDYPELPEPYNNLAVLYAQQKQYDRARSALEMAIRTHPSYAIAYENLGDVYAKMASQAYDKALQLDTSNAAAQSKLALIRELVSAPGGSHAPSVKPPAATTSPVTTAAAPPAATTTAVATAPAPASAATPPVSPGTPPAPPGKVENGAADAHQELARTLAAWAAAWSRQDVKAYLGHYAGSFKPPGGMSRKAWEAERAERLKRPKWIRVSYGAPQIRIDGKAATARFRQNYQTPSLRNATHKTLTFARVGNAWQIISEQTD
ncbi:MAG: tetratricopeptide repeat protein [Zoogloeaceae bacterium]|jgi:tetratricopeptide (TPR) repeat protein|nr:tetratricopeptide repeat protein [Zoogloeaceae bacterium]